MPPHLWPSLHIMYTYANVCTRVDIRLVVKRKQVPRRYNIGTGTLRAGHGSDDRCPALAKLCPYCSGRYSQPYQARTAAGVWDLQQSYALSRLLPSRQHSSISFISGGKNTTCKVTDRFVSPIGSVRQLKHTPNLTLNWTRQVTVYNMLMSRCLLRHLTTKLNLEVRIPCSDEASSVLMY